MLLRTRKKVFQRYPNVSVEPCNTSAWQVVIFGGKRIKRQPKKNRSDSQDPWMNAESQADGVELKYTSVIFTEWLLWTLPLTTPMSTHIMDTTFNTSTRARALNSLVIVSSHHPWRVLLAVHWSIAEHHPMNKIFQVRYISLTSSQYASTPRVSTTPSLHKAR